ncbi:TRAP transporter substrate-binding protein [Stappia sp. F7233]|uniref:TRAP transporter substrate-binding protein n=1 Tax=Stappia albiluteola TaxID=2758565 RepID=A0A839AK72_9HYPH|nr:TRAP transporter substrate-binding protein [Stappia albiluteola]MBA5779428.1 TRAP transporter substrate-binding protein [Stappia albiluteola]
MRLEKLLRVTALAGTLVALAGASAIAADWRGWNIHPEGYPNTVALEQFAKDVAEKTDGRVTPTVYNGGVLGSQPDAIEQTRNGALDFANFNLGPMGPIVPATNVLSLPFLFTGVDQMHKVMDGEIGQRFSDAMAEQGLVALAWYDSGSRSFYNTRQPIQTPADLAGMKVRVMNNDLYVQMIDQLGGNATPMAYGEVYQSLKTGVIDGAENNYPSFESSNHYEVAKFYSITDHLIIPECVCIAKASWDKLSPEDQEIVRQAAIDSATLQRKLWEERSVASRQKVEESGVKVNEVQDKKAFQEKMAPVYAAFIKANPDLEEWITAIQSTN